MMFTAESKLISIDCLADFDHRSSFPIADGALYGGVHGLALCLHLGELIARLNRWQAAYPPEHVCHVAVNARDALAAVLPRFEPAVHLEEAGTKSVCLVPSAVPVVIDFGFLHKRVFVHAI